MIPKRKMRRWMFILVATLLALPFLLSFMGLLPWSPINCWHYEVDIHSGRIRYTRYFAFIRMSQRIDESALSRALQPDDLRETPPNWKRALTFSPGGHNSPHYVFHSAISQIQELELIWRVGEFTSAARRSSAKRLLELWQEGQSDDAAKPYLREISDDALPLNSERKSTDVADPPELP